MTMDTIFYINGDHTYVTARKPITEGKTYFLFTLKGEGEISYNGTSFISRPNTFVFMQPTQDFSYRCREQKWEFWWFEFLGPCPCSADVQMDFTSNHLAITLMSKSLQYAKNGNWDVASSLFLSLTKVLLHGAGRSNKTAHNERVVSTIEEYIRENMDTVTVQELSEVFHIEERTLRNIFCSVTDMTPKRFITKMRMDYGSHLLVSTTKSLDQVALTLGFSSQYHFGKAFKEYFGVTPMRYRKLITMW